MKMYELVEWFQINYPSLHHDLLMCSHNFDNSSINPYHIETDCWSHTMMVCKVAELYRYDTVVMVAALLHDIGKPSVRNINMKNHHVQFFEHEDHSAKIAKDIVDKMVDEKMISFAQASEIIDLIQNHSIFFKDPHPHELFKMFEHSKTKYIHLVQLCYCDSLGRFTSNSYFDESKYKLLLSYAKNMSD